jgi:hypothetical protein
MWQQLLAVLWRWAGSRGRARAPSPADDPVVRQFYTEEPQVHAQALLQLQRLDYVVSAWLRVRRQVGGCGGAGAGPGQLRDAVGERHACLLGRLQLLVGKCYLSP